MAKVNNIDTSGFVLKTKYDTDKSELGKKIPDTSGLVKKLKCNATINEKEGKITSVSGLATTYALTEVGNKVADVSSFVKKSDYDTRISEIEKKVADHNHEKYITTPEFNNLTAEVFDAGLNRASILSK